jgi:DNA repair exonuclease SbcCD ATPase subunit
MGKVQASNDEIHAMLVASFARLNAEFGFALVVAPAASLRKHVDDLDLIEKNYVQYLGLAQAIRLAQTGFQEQFRRMLISRLRVVFDAASHDIEAWNKTASSQVDTQLRERRRNFKRRYESLERIQSASSELDARLNEVQSQETHVQQLQQQLDALVDGLVRQAESDPMTQHVSLEA